MKNRRVRARDASEFDVWGCRGSRSFPLQRSSIGNHTSCYSLHHAGDVFVFDAGRGLLALSDAMRRRARFRPVRRVHVLVSHAHLDHWEGLKDAEWFWRRKNGLDIHILGSGETLAAIRTAYGHPLYVALELLAAKTVWRVRYEALRAGESRAIRGFRLRTEALNHYSGEPEDPRRLDTLGFNLRAPDGATVAYVSDHEPTPDTRAVEERLLRGAHAAVVDSHFPDIKDHEHGHGSQQYAAGLARAHPGMVVLAAHHGPTLTDAMIRAAHRRHRRNAGNFELAIEGASYLWDAPRGAFVPRPSRVPVKPQGKR
jgi:phosphoribosyl 1,2-cyclic phosphodiesterase